MNERIGRGEPATRSDDPLEPLFGVAGRRARLPEDEVEPIRGAARAAWQRSLRRGATRRRAAAAAVAAGALLGVGLLVRDRAPEPEAAPVPVGEVELRAGEVTVRGSGSSSPVLGAGSVLVTGNAGRAALRLAGGAALRVDVASRVRFESATLVALEQGAVYVDSDPRSASAPIAIATPLGTVRHAGTQFEVRLLDAGSATEAPKRALRVTVREGAVTLDFRGREYEARAGAELTLRSDGSLERGIASAQGTTWAWTHRAAPALEIEGETLATFLDWVSRETGLRWQYASSGLERVTRETVLHGSIAGLTPEEALAEVLAGSGMRYRRSELALVLEPVARP